MRTYLECIPCCFEQALITAQRSGCSKKKQKEIIDKLLISFPGIDLKKSPPENAIHIYGLVKKISGCDDPYKKEKIKSNKLALKIYPKIKEQIKVSKNKLLRAIEISIAGNIIDFGIKKSINIAKEIKELIKKEDNSIKKQRKSLFCFDRFEKKLKRSNKILVLGDNAGEIVFDRILIETIKELYTQKEFIYAVKSKPIINDVLLEDAYMCSMDKVAKVIESGCDRPGTIIELCDSKFKKLLRNVDMIISKGQGNYEALSEEKGYPVFFLFMAKCHVIANHLKCSINDIILKRL